MNRIILLLLLSSAIFAQVEAAGANRNSVGMDMVVGESLAPPADISKRDEKGTQQQNLRRKLENEGKNNDAAEPEAVGEDGGGNEVAEKGKGGGKANNVDEKDAAAAAAKAEATTDKTKDATPEDETKGSDTPKDGGSEQEEEQNDPTGNNADTTSGEKQENAFNDGDDSATVPFPVLMLGLVMIIFALRKKMTEGSRFGGIGGGGAGGRNWYSGGSNASDDFTYGASIASNIREFTGGSRNLSRRHLQEMVPLSTANEDEWGWENSNASHDLERGVIAASAKEEEDLQMALAMSLSEKSSTSGESSVSSKRRTVQSRIPAPAPAPTPTPTPAVEQSDSWDDVGSWDEHAPIDVSSSSTKVPPTPMSSPDPIGGKTFSAAGTAVTAQSIEELLREQAKKSKVPTITSLSMPKPASKTSISPKKKPKKKEEEDIFASMGLSALPKRTNTNLTSASSVSTKSTVQTTNIRKKSSPPSWQQKEEIKSNALPAVDDGGSLGGSDHWGDDGDLDDLLED